ncbi:MAG: PAS domain-containing protein [Hyphomicrobium sp.]
MPSERMAEFWKDAGVELREDWHKTSDMGTEHGMGDPFAAAVRWSRMPMCFSDPRQIDLPIVYANDAFCKMTGYDLSEIAGKNCRFLQGADTDPEAIVLIRKAIEGRKAIGIDILNYRKDGSTFWNALFVSPVFNESGELLYFFSSQFDATERLKQVQAVASRKSEIETEMAARKRELNQSLLTLEKSLQEKTLLIHEIDHRVKNNLQTISTLIGLQLRQLSEPSAVRALKSLHERVDALGAVHRRLTTSGSVGSFDLAQLINDLVPEIVKGAARGDIEVELDVCPILLGSALATPVSLIINELVTNAVRHAWDEGQAGRLVVSSAIENRQVTLKISDNGWGMTSSESGRSLSGLKLTEALVRQMRGTLVTRPSSAGTTIEIGLPLP